MAATTVATKKYIFSTPVHMRAYKFRDTIYCLRHSNSKSICLDLMSVNRQICAETFPLVYQTLPFIIYEFAALPSLRQLSSIACENTTRLDFCLRWHFLGPNAIHVHNLTSSLAFITKYMHVKALALDVDYIVSDSVNDVNEDESKEDWVRTFNAIHASAASRLNIHVFLRMRIEDFSWDALAPTPGKVEELAGL